MAGRISALVLTAAALATGLLPVAAQARPDWGGRNWGGRGWHRDRGGIDGGDVLAGVLILGGIAAIASAASNAERKRNRDMDDYRYRQGDEDLRDDTARGSTGDWSRNGGAGRAVRSLNDAVDACATEAGRTGEVEDIDDAIRQGSDFRVSGTLRNGDRFSCDVSPQGGVLLDIRRGRI